MTPSIELSTITSAIISAVADVERIYLFGSRAREDARADSDYDIYIVLPNEGVTQLEAAANAYRALYPSRLKFHNGSRFALLHYLKIACRLSLVIFEDKNHERRVRRPRRPPLITL